MLAALVGLVPALALGTTDGRQPEVIRLKPPETVQWGLRNVGAGITSVFGMWSYWYSDISTVVETVPADAQLEVFYIRANFQKQFVRTSPPVKLVMPSRIRTTHRDALTLRVSASGFKGQEQTHPVHRLPGKITIQLAPLPNTLTFVGYTHLAERGTLTLRTTKEPEFRVMRSRGEPGFTLALAETANQTGDGAGLAGGQLRGLELSQVGEDLLLKIATRDDQVEARSKQRYDPIREEHVFLLDLVEKGARAPSSDQVRRELERIGVPPLGACRDRFEAVLRDGIDPEVIARAHRPEGSIADLYRREGMLRVGREAQGSVQLAGGESLRTGNPLELELALQSAGRVSGYLAFQAAFARTQPEPEVALRSLLAPDLAPAEFAELYRRAEALRAECPQ